MEEWKPVVGYEGYYEVSSTGKVRSVERLIEKSNGVIQCRRSKPKATRINEDGYVTVKLSRCGMSWCCFVHRIVYESFIGTIPDGYEINHKDFDRTNNTPENLEAISHTDNIKYTYDAGRHYAVKNDLSGTNNPNYGNRALSKMYSANPEMSREKQGRPGLQNGRCVRIVAKFPNGTVKEYGCIKHCAEDLISSGISKGKPEHVYQRIWASMRRNVPYKGITFECI